MFSSPSEALQQLPPLTTPVETCNRPLPILHKSFDETMLFTARVTPKWSTDKLFLSGLSLRCSQSATEKWIAVDDRVALSVKEIPFAALPSFRSAVNTVAIHYYSSSIGAAAVGTNGALDVILFECGSNLKVLDHQSLSLSSGCAFIVWVDGNKLLLIDGLSNPMSANVAVSNKEITLSSTGPNMFEALRKLFRTSTLFKAAAYDSARHHVFILSRSELSVWSTSSTSIERRATLAIGDSAVSVHESHAEEQHLAMVVFSCGKRQFFKSTGLSHGRSMKLQMAFEIVIPALVMKSVKCAASFLGTTVMYDSASATLVVEGTAVPFYEVEGTNGLYDVVTTLQVAESVTSIATVLEDGATEATFVVLGDGGPLMTIRRRPFSEILKLRLLQFSASVLPRAMGCLGDEVAARLLIDAFDMHSDELERGVMSASVASIMSPQLDDTKTEITFSPIVGAVRRIALETLSTISFLLCDCLDEESSKCLERQFEVTSLFLRKLSELFGPQGWLDTTHANALCQRATWRELRVRCEGAQTIQQACALQAMFLHELVGGLEFLRVLCWLYHTARKHLTPVAALSSPLSAIVWVPNLRRKELISIAWSFVENSNNAGIADILEMVNYFPPVISARITLRELAARDDSKVLPFVEASLGLFSADGLVLDVAEALEMTIPNKRMKLAVIALWATRENNSDACRCALEFLESVAPEYLRECEYYFQCLPQQEVVEWMFQHTLDDRRIKILAEIFCSMSPALNGLPNAETSAQQHVRAFFTATFVKKTDKLAAHERFTAIAESLGDVTLESRIMCAEEALDCENAFSARRQLKYLQLQRKLRDRLAACAVEAEADEELRGATHDLTILLTNKLVSEQFLFETAAKYEAFPGVNGGEVELELLLLFDETSPFEFNSLVGPLEAIWSVGIASSSPQAVAHSLISNYFRQIRADLSICFIQWLVEHLFLESDGRIVGDCESMLACGVPAVTAFGALLGVMKQFRSHIDEVLRSLTFIVRCVEPAEMQRILISDFRDVAHFLLAEHHKGNQELHPADELALQNAFYDETMSSEPLVRFSTQTFN